MFSINFIRHETVPLQLRRVLIYAALGYVLGQLALGLGLVATAASYHLQAQQGLRGSAAPAATPQLHDEMSLLRVHATAERITLDEMIAIQRQRFPAAGKLAALATTLPGRVWLRSISGDRDRRTLSVEAAYLVDPERPAAMPTKDWIAALKSDPRIRQDLKRLELAGSSRAMQGKAELFLFKLDGEWNP